MPTYTQAGQPMWVASSLDPDELLLEGFSGSEGVSKPFLYHVDLLSEDSAIDAEALLGTPLALVVDLPWAETRVIHGRVRRFVQAGQSEELSSYHAELVPWFWFLSLSRDCRIFQELSVPDIVTTILEEQGYQGDFEFKLSGAYPPRDYCVQYRETHLDFISRLLEEEGIWYFFSHEEDKHVMVITDDIATVEPCPGFPAARVVENPALGEDAVRQIRREHAVHVGAVTLRAYDYLQPSLSLERGHTGNGTGEVYDYPGGYVEPDEGDRYALLRLEGEEAMRHLIRGESTCRGFQSGYSFELEEHFRRDANRAYTILEVEHHARTGAYRSRGESELDYRNVFLAIPDDVPYRPPRLRRKPAVRGLQTAVVVGPSSEEVYVDQHGRIKVQFHWDRLGQFDENSSCWVRVATPWAGKAWGAISIPRIGNEAVVEFEEGDPDRPLVIGSVYNAQQTPPFDLPGSGVQMGMKTRSSKGGGGFNEITMTDTKGSEKVTIHAQKDMGTKVLNDQTLSVGNDRSGTIEHDDSLTVHNDRTIVVDGTHTETIKKDVTIAVTEGQQATTVNKSVELTSETDKIHVTAATEIQLEVGASKLLMKEDGTIEISGINVSVKGVAVAVDGSAKVAIHGAIVSSEADAAHTTKGAIVLSEGSATNTVKGAMVMLNP